VEGKKILSFERTTIVTNFSILIDKELIVIVIVAVG
jgi:hypothetical protein